MKRTAILTAFLCLALGPLQAQNPSVPLFINYQGTVTDSTGLPLGATGTPQAPVAAPTNRKIIFRIYDGPTGTGLLWSEEQTVTISVGQFSVLLGQGIQFGTENNDPIENVFTSAAGGSPEGPLRYLSITVDNGDGTLDGSDVPISPRQQITTTAYSFRARAADTIASGTSLQLNDSDDYGLGYYGTGRTFNSTQIDGPVLYGLSGGALGSVSGATQKTALRWNQLGQVGIGSATLSAAAANTKLVVQGDDTSFPSSQLTIRGDSDINNRLLLGYRTNGDYATIQSYSAATTPSDLYLNGSGGTIRLGNSAYDTIAGGGILARTGYGAHNGYSFNSDSDTGMYRATTNALGFYTGNAERVRINASGNVGIGKTNPGQKLDVAGNIAASGNIVANGSASILGGSRLALTLQNSNPGLSLTSTATSGHSFSLYSGGDGVLRILDDTSGIYSMAIGPTGNTGFGNSSAATKAKVEITGTGANYTWAGTWGILNTGGANTIPNGGTQALSLYCSGWARAPLWLVTSDERIKNIEGRSDAAHDLSILQGIEVTDYSFIDTLNNGAGKHKKVIAQQVEKVFPQAVSRSTDEVPDIYKKAKIEDGWINLATDLKKGELIRLITPKEDGVQKVLEVEKDRFRTDLVTEEEEVFVYGREVKDFRGVDYDAIAMLNVSATQELARKIEVQDTEMKKLQEENALLRASLEAQKKRVTVLEARGKSRDARLVAIEELLSSRPAANLGGARKTFGAAE